MGLLLLQGCTDVERHESTWRVADAIQSAGACLTDTHQYSNVALQLRIEADAIEPIASPIVGFLLKDRLGQHLFGCNTWSAMRKLPPVPAGDGIVASFEFHIPILPAGNYTIDVAIADGSELDHVQTAWLFDALALRSTNSTIGNGLVGIPYLSVRLESRSG